MKSLYYICTQPATLYYAWQVEVMIHNFIKNRIPANRIQVVSAVNNGDITIEWKKLQSHFHDVGFYFYEDERTDTVYPVSVRPHLLKKHFKEHSYLTTEAVMYHDCDMVFTKPVSWDEYTNDDTWYGSDTNSYLGSDYIKSKGFGVYERMCELVGISEEVPIQKDTIGAQIIMKNLTVEYWQKVEQDSNSLYRFFREHLKEHPQTAEYHPIQMWTAEMWAILWNAWKFGYTTKVADDMDFAWSGHRLSNWEEKRIYHNAGVVELSQTERLFYKGGYIHKLPYKEIDLGWIHPDRCSYKYAEEILETAAKSCII